MLWYTLSLCPKCKDNLVKRSFAGEDDYKIIQCPSCGRRMLPVLSGEEPVEDAEKITYKIVLNEVIIDEMQDKCVNVIMQIGGFNEEEALEKYNTENSVIFEGDLLNTYLSLWLLGESCYYLKYTVNPPLPYKIRFPLLCPDCGEVPTYKKEETGTGRVIRDGFARTATSGSLMVHCKMYITKTDTIGDLIKAQLRDGTKYCSKDADVFMRSLLEEFIEDFPDIPLYLRGDSGFASSDLYEVFEKKAVNMPSAERKQQVHQTEFYETLANIKNLAPQLEQQL